MLVRAPDLVIPWADHVRRADSERSRLAAACSILVPCVGVAVGHQPLIVGVAFLSPGAKQEGVMAGWLDHNIEELGTVGAVDLCTVTDAAMRLLLPRLVFTGGRGADDVCTVVVRLLMGLRAWRLLRTGLHAGEDFVSVVDEGGEMSSVLVDAETRVG